MNLGKYRNVITVQQLYDYALIHNYLKADASTVLSIIDKERNTKKTIENNINPVDNISTVDFSKIVEYKYEDLIALFST